MNSAQTDTNRGIEHLLAKPGQSVQHCRWPRMSPATIMGSGANSGLWREFRERCYPGWRMTRLRSRAKPARPYIWRLIILIRFTLPSTAAEL